MLGNEQDCYGGCTNFRQAFYGMMDEVCPCLSGYVLSACGQCKCHSLPLKDSKDMIEQLYLQASGEVPWDTGTAVEDRAISGGGPDPHAAGNRLGESQRSTGLLEIR